MILFLVNTFPSLERKNDGAFNLKAAKQLSSVIDVTIIHLRSWHPKRKFIETYHIDGLEINVFSFPFFPKTSPKMSGVQIYLYKKVFYFFNKKKIKGIKVIHSVGASLSGVVGSYISRRTGIKHVAQCIGSDINFNLPMLKDCFGYKNWEQNVNFFICNSKELSKSVQIIYPEAKTMVIYRGVDLNEFYYENRKYNEIKRVRFLFLGGLSVRSETPYGANLKGGLTVLKAWKNLIDANPQLSEKSVLCFGGPQTTKAKIISEMKIADLGLYSVEFIGQLNKKQVKEYMQNAHVVLIPSMSEGLPNISLEAAASGCALIATDVGGIHEVVINGYNGSLIEPGNVRQLVLSMKELIMDTQNLKKLGENSRNLVEMKFNNSQFLKGYLAVYYSLIEEG